MKRSMLFVVELSVDTVIMSQQNYNHDVVLKAAPKIVADEIASNLESAGYVVENSVKVYLAGEIE